MIFDVLQLQLVPRIGIFVVALPYDGFHAWSLLGEWLAIHKHWPLLNYVINTITIFSVFHPSFWRHSISNETVRHLKAVGDIDASYSHVFFSIVHADSSVNIINLWCSMENYLFLVWRFVVFHDATNSRPIVSPFFLSFRASLQIRDDFLLSFWYTNIYIYSINGIPCMQKHWIFICAYYFFYIWFQILSGIQHSMLQIRW